MIVQKFSAWAEAAGPETRAAGAAALAHAYLGDMLDLDRRSAEVALTVLLDDPSTLVRRTLAEIFAGSCEAPHHIVLALAMDRSEVSAIVLARSPLLSDEELIDCAAIGDAFAQAAIALRARVSQNVAATIAEIGAREALISLAVNAKADLAPFSMRRIFERGGEDGEVREALLHHPHLPDDLRVDIAGKTAEALAEFVTSCAWMTSERAARTAREALERATVVIAADGDSTGVRALAAHLRASGQLTLALILRSLLSGERALLHSALCELSGLPHERVAGLLRNWADGGFAAVYDKAGLPRALLPAIRAALSAQDAFGRETSAGDDDAARLSMRLVERVLTACDELEGAGLGPVTALLRRLACEAAREEARETSRAWKPAQKALPKPMVEIDLAALEAELMAA